jgi:hypothetical protein
MGDCNKSGSPHQDSSTTCLMFLTFTKLPEDGVSKLAATLLGKDVAMPDSNRVSPRPCL